MRRFLTLKILTSPEASCEETPLTLTTFCPSLNRTGRFCYLHNEAVMSSPLEAPEQANNDRKQLILKQRARIDPLTAPENMTKGLLDLPAELLIEICTLVFGDKVRVNINVLHRRGSSPSRQFMNALPAEMSKLDGLLKCSRATRNYAYIVLGRQVLFDANSINFTDLPLAFGKDNCLRMHRLDLYAHFEVKTGQDSVWTDLLQMFVRDLSNLVYFELWSVHDQCRPPYPESESRDPEGSVSRHNQECRSLMQFAAYLINLHPKLDRLIKDALDGPTYKEGELKVFNNYVIDQFSNKRPWQSRTSFTDESRTKKETIEVIVTRSWKRA